MKGTSEAEASASIRHREGVIVTNFQERRGARAAFLAILPALILRAVALL
jgi:hypothetical protein